MCHVHQSVTETQTKIWQTKRFGRIQNYTEMTKEINSLLTLSRGCHQGQESLQPHTFHLLMLLGNFFPEMKQSQCWKHSFAFLVQIMLFFQKITNFSILLNSLKI